MKRNELGIIVVLLFSLVFLLGCTSNQPKTDQQNILAPPKSLCADAFKGTLDTGDVLNAGKYTVTLNSVSLGSPNQVTVTVKDLLSGDGKKVTLTEGTATDVMFGTSKVSILLSGMEIVGGTKAKIELCYDHPKKCETPIAKGIVNEGEKLDVAGTYTVSMVSIKSGTPNIAQVEILDSKTMAILAKADLIEGVPTEVNLGATKLVLTFSMTFATVPKPQIEVCGDVVGQPTPVPKCNPSIGGADGTIKVSQSLLAHGRYEITLVGVQSDMGKKFAIVNVIDKVTLIQKQVAIEEGGQVDIVFGGEILSIWADNIKPEIIAKESSAHIVVCAKPAPLPPKCNPSTGGTTSRTMRVGDTFLVNAAYQVKLKDISDFAGRKYALFSVTDTTSMEEQVVGIEEGTTLEITLKTGSVTISVNSISIATVDSAVIDSCGKSNFGGGIIN